MKDNSQDAPDAAQLDTVIYNGTVVTGNPELDIVEAAIVGIKDGEVVRLEKETPDHPVPEARKRLNAEGALVVPGLVNTHTHLPMTLFRGLADDLPLDRWLNEHIFPAEARHVNPDSVYWGSLLACCEMLLSGTTSCCDGYFHEDHVAVAVSESGMRGVLGQGVIDFPAPGVPDPERNVEAAVRFVEDWKQKSPLIRPSIFCHSPYTCAEKTLVSAKKAAKEHDALFQIHVAETLRERKDCEAQRGESPVRYLERLGILDKNTLLVHAVWIDDEDIEIIRRTGAAVSHAPESNMKLASGTAPVPKLIESKVPLGLGTDGCASNNTLDLFSAMDVCAKLHKVHTLDPTVSSARQVFAMATAGGAASIGLENLVGSIVIGKRADIVLVDIRKPHLVPVYSPISHLVYAVKGTDVAHVFVDGNHVVENGRITTLDVNEIMDRVSMLAIGIARGDENHAI